jgi:hypothetical protein
MLNRHKRDGGAILKGRRELGRSQKKIEQRAICRRFRPGAC